MNVFGALSPFYYYIAMEKISPPEIDRIALLNTFVDTMKQKLGSELISVILFGSAAENRMRPQSDINLLVVLRSCQLETLNKINTDYREQRGLIKLTCLFLEKEDLPAAFISFPIKFLDISRRSQVLFGEDLIPQIKIDPVHLKFQLQQTILNLRIRLRERYTVASLRQEQLVNIMNEFSGPLRSCAFSIADIAGTSPKNPKQAMASFLESYFPDRAKTMGQTISTIREESGLSPEQIIPAFKDYFEILSKMQEVASR